MGSISYNIVLISDQRLQQGGDYSFLSKNSTETQSIIVSGEKAGRGPFEKAGKAVPPCFTMFTQHDAPSPGKGYTSPYGASSYGGPSDLHSVLQFTTVKTHGKPSALHAGDMEAKTVYTHGDMTVLEKSLGTKQQVSMTHK